MRRLARWVGLSRTPKLPPAGPVRVVIFDFDGTIGDTFWQGLEILNRMAGEFGYQPLAESELPKARDMTTRQLMRHLGISSRKLPTIASRGVRELRARIAEVEPIAGVPEMLRALRERGLRLGIVTSNSEENVGVFLRRHELDFFEFVRSSSRLLGKGREIRQAMRRHVFTPAETVYVGDETRDIEACKRAGLRCVAVSWGYNSARVLAAQKPHALIEQPGELLPLIEATQASPDESV